ncbi:Rv0361 family membrane protein [Mycolicibacterium peregrinum]|uniref:Rv0361 family membrane protein n=1 Tax=Mycolicibacterium peregrinum TaxID=43304 RepID=UPI000A9A39B2|nr:hypothetical protein [Mycolicibacterium peregrinum]
MTGPTSPFGGDPNIPGAPDWGTPQQPCPPTSYGQPPSYPPSGYPTPGGAPPVYGIPQSGFPQPWQGYQQEQPGTSAGRSKLLIALAIAVPVLLILCGVGGWIWFSTSREKGAIKDVASRFAEAIDTQDQDKMLATLCQEEHDLVTDGDGFDPGDSGPGAKDNRQPFEVTDVTVKDDVAQVQFLRPNSEHSGSLYLRKESGAWKVCDPAEAQFNE